MVTTTEKMFRKGKPDRQRADADDAPVARSPRTLVVYRALSDVAAKAAMFLVTIAAARRLDAGAFGLFALATTLGWLVAVGSDFGLQLHTARAVAQAPASARRLVRQWLPARLLTGAVALAIAVVALALAGDDRRSAAIVLVFVLGYSAQGLAEFFHYVFRGLGRSDLESTLTLVHRGLMLTCCTAALVWAPSATGLAVALFAASSVAAGLAWAVARRLLAPSPSGADPLPAHAVAADVSRAREFVTMVAPIGAGILLSALYFRIDVFLLDRWTGAASVGIYAAVFRIVDALRLFPAAVLAVALPELCRTTLLRPVTLLALRLGAAAAALSLALWLGAPWLVPALYGSTFVASVEPFRVLLLAFPLMAINYALTHQLIGWHGQRAYAALCGTALVLNVGVNARWIPQYGAQGAAWSTVLTELFVLAGCSAALLRARRTPAARSEVLSEQVPVVS